MRKAIIPAFLLLLGSAVLGATVFHEPLARAASGMSTLANAKSTPVTETNVDAQGNIKIHEQGIATVRSASQEVSATAAASAQLSTDCGGILYTVPAGKQLVIDYISAFANVAGATSANGSISADSSQPIGHLLPVVFANQAFDDFSASEAVHYVMPAGTVIHFGASFAGADHCSVRFALGGTLETAP